MLSSRINKIKIKWLLWAFVVVIGILYITIISESNKEIREAESYYVRGLVHYQIGNYEQAIVNYTKAINLKPDYAIAYFARGLVYRKMGEKEKAIIDFRKVIEISTHRPIRIIVRQGQRQKVIETKIITTLQREAEEQLKELGAKDSSYK